jgi:uncharacterized protein YecT (DUF1311 family)
MKTLSIISLLLLLTNCAGGNMAKMKIGKRCTVSDTNQLTRVFLHLVCKQRCVKDFDKRINKSNCLDS